MTSTRAEVCAVACAELFRDAGEIMISPMTNAPPPATAIAFQGLSSTYSPTTRAR